MDKETQKVVFSSADENWETPHDFFHWLHGIFHFTLDVAANEKNHKLPRWLGPGSSLASDALGVGWGNERCWMNPPYGRKIGYWVRKAWMESVKHPGYDGTHVVCLLPARTDTVWFHSYCKYGQPIVFLRGRLKFVGADASAPFPSMLVIFNNPLVRDEMEVAGFHEMECWRH